VYLDRVNNYQALEENVIMLFVGKETDTLT
jgi:hypothetical protein